MAIRVRAIGVAVVGSVLLGYIAYVVVILCAAIGGTSAIQSGLTKNIAGGAFLGAAISGGSQLYKRLVRRWQRAL